ncbi:MAG: hypothetical protein ACOCUD_05125 [Bacillota bacterium]
MNYNKSASETQINFNKLMSYMNTGCEHKECFYHKCSEKVISAHSIQNNRILNQISDNGDVLAFNTSFDDKDLLIHDLNKVGRKKASTFLGFCNKHDTDIFKPIELFDYKNGDLEQNFLFAYRSLAKEYSAKMSAYNLYKKLKVINTSDLDEIYKKLNIKRSVKITEDRKEIISQFYHGTSDSVGFLNNLRIEMNINLIKKKFSKISSYIIEIPEEYPFALSSMFLIQKDVEGNTINDLSLFQNLKPTFLTIFPQNGKSNIIISYRRKDKNYFKFIEDQILSENMDIQKKILSNIITYYVENIFISPIWWNNLDESYRKDYVEMFNKTIMSFPDSLFFDKELNIFKNYSDN